MRRLQWLRLVVAVAVGVMLVAAAPPAPAKQPPVADPLDLVLERLDTLRPAFGSAGRTAITVARLDTASAASRRGSELFKAASVVKPVWMAAALDRAGVAGTEHLAYGALFRSWDDPAGAVIDVAGGIDLVNRWSLDRGLSDTIAYEWLFGGERRSRLYPGPIRGLNTTTTDDLVAFWHMVHRGLALQGEERAALLEWTRGRKSWIEGDRLVIRLPEEVIAASSFKMGYLPVGREYQLHDGETGPGGETVIFTWGAVDIGAGLIRVPGGPTYAIAIGAYNGESWRAMTAWVEYGSCVVYSAITHDAADCTRSRDPAGIRNRVTAPAGALEIVRAHHGFPSVAGWAADPDAWWNPTLVTITVDGAAIGSVAAVPHDLADLARPRFARRLPYEMEPGLHEVCAIARNDGSGPDTPLGCVMIEVRDSRP